MRRARLLLQPREALGRLGLLAALACCDLGLSARGRRRRRPRVVDRLARAYAEQVLHVRRLDLDLAGELLRGIGVRQQLEHL